MVHRVHVYYSSSRTSFHEFQARDTAAAFAGGLVAYELSAHNARADITDDEEGLIVVQVNRP